jgi:alpha-ribazole phosphatase
MKAANRLYLIRHGQVEGYETFPVYGHTDVDLTEVGLLQMEHLAERLRLAEIHEIYSSDLKRCLRGARIIARNHDVPIYPKPELREIRFGAWEGLTFKEIRERYPDDLDKRERDILGFAPPMGGESVTGLAARVMDCFESIMRDADGKNVLLAGHGVVNRVILCDALGLDRRKMFAIQQDYGCLNIIDYHPDRKLVRLVNG